MIENVLLLLIHKWKTNTKVKTYNFIQFIRILFYFQVLSLFCVFIL
jgi:hypothetical protein